MGPRGDPGVLPLGALAEADRLLARDDGAGGGAGRELPERLSRPEHGRRRLERLRCGSRRRLQHAGDARAPPRLARPRALAAGAPRLRARVARRGRRGAAGGGRPGPPAAGCARGAGLRRGRSAARRDRRPRVGGAGRRRRLPAPPPPLTVDVVYGRREVLELWATERAVGAEPWLAEAKPKLRPERELSELAGTRDHQGVAARVEPYRYADAYELA